MNYKRLIVFFLIAAGTFSCQQITDVCEEDKEASSIIYSFPDSIYVSTPYYLSIHYIVENSCGDLLAFKDSTYGATTEIKTMMHYEGCNCNLSFTEDSSIYVIQHDTTGEYTYKFYVGNGDFDTYLLKVVN